MSFEVTIPPELWLIIFEMVIATEVMLLEHCDRGRFPDVHEYLCSPFTHAPIDNSYCQLRLVCRTFNALLESSPHYFMKLAQDPIPNTARAVYITERFGYSDCFRRLLAEPSASNRIVSLHASCCFYSFSSGTTAVFDVLCDNSQSLLNIRCLTLRIMHNPYTPMVVPFWWRLNSAFPLLRRLVLAINHHQVGHLVLWKECDGEIIFQNLEILILVRRMRYVPGIRFPRLRHLALDAHFPVELATLTSSPLLESMLFRFGSPIFSIDLTAFPRLRLLGVLESKVSDILPIGSDHPLQHLWIYANPSISASHLLNSMMHVTKRLSGISRLTVELDPIHLRGFVSPEGELRNTNLQPIGLSMLPTPSGGSRILFKTTRPDFRMSVHSEAFTI